MRIIYPIIFGIALDLDLVWAALKSDEMLEMRKAAVGRYSVEFQMWGDSREL